MTDGEGFETAKVRTPDDSRGVSEHFTSKMGKYCHLE